jgi:hypothetical protein
MNQSCLRAFSVWLLVTIAGCGGSGGVETDDEPVPLAAPEQRGAERETNDAPTAKGPYPKHFDGMSFTVPETWKEIEVPAGKRQFGQRARFLIPANGDEVELTCSTVGGGIDANVGRWVGQFQLPAGEKPTIETIRIDSVAAKWVDLRGKFQTFLSGGGSAKDDWRMLGVAIPKKPQDLYLKLTGPRASVAKIQEEFRSFAKSGRFTD